MGLGGDLVVVLLPDEMDVLGMGEGGTDIGEQDEFLTDL